MAAAQEIPKCASGSVVPASWRKHFRQSEIVSCDLPLEVGGAASDLPTTLAIFHDACAIDLNLRDLPGGGHGRMMLLASDFKTGKYKSILTELCHCTAFIALAVTEASAGSALTHLNTTYEKADNGYILNGSKECLGRFELATHVIILARSKSNRKSLSAFLVPLPHRDLTFKRREAEGLDAVYWGDLEIRSAHIPIESIVGAEGEGRILFNRHFTHWRLTMTAASIGCAVRGLYKTSEWLLRRRIGSTLLSDESLIQSSFSQHVYRLQAAWTMVLHAAESGDKDERDLVKGQGIEDCLAALTWCQSVIGRYGYGYQTEKLDISKRREDVRGLTISSGSSESLKLAFARHQLSIDQ